MVRPADPNRDAAACAAVYGPAVTDGFASFEEEAPDAEEMAARIVAARAWLVCERDDEVVGWANAGPFNPRAAYRWSVSVGVYTAMERRRQGVGRELYDGLLPSLAARGFTSALAGISLPNPGSVALHEAFGFERAALYRDVGYKAGAWRDVAWFQRHLAPRQDPPLETTG